MSDYKNGEMDISVQEKTFEGFTKTVAYGAVVCICILIFMGLVNG